MRQLSELDASFLYLESDTAPMHIGGVYLFDASDPTVSLSFDTFVSYLHSRLHVVPLFRQKLKEIPLRLGRPYWIDDPDFSIDRHLSHIDLGGQGATPQLVDLAEKILEQRLPRDRPLWHITFADGFLLSGRGEEARPGAALIIKLHHAAIDAFSGEEIIGKLLEYTPKPHPIASPKPWHPRPEPSPERVVIQTGANILKTPLQLTSLAMHATEAATRGLLQNHLHRLPLPIPLFSAPQSPFNQQVTGRRQIVAATLHLSRLKAIKAALGDVTLNDVVLGLCAETLHRYMLSQHSDTSRSLVAMTPVSVRSSSLRRPTGNQMSAMLLDLATDEPDPARRIRRIHGNAVASEPYRDAIAADRLTELVPSTMLALSARLYSELQIAQRYQPAFNLPVTNVPGPQVPLYLQGARLVRQYNTAPLFDSMGLVIVAVSYQGDLTINFTLCPDVVADGSSLAELASQSLDAIEEAAGKLEPEQDNDFDGESAGHSLTDDALRALAGLLQKTVKRFRI